MRIGNDAQVFHCDVGSFGRKGLKFADALATNYTSGGLRNLYTASG